MKRNEIKLLSDCIERVKMAMICRDEEGKQICFSHDKYEFSCEVVQVEQCIFKNVQGGKRCDYLFLFDRSKQEYRFLENSLAYFVELKGTGLVEACEQLYNSIDLTMSQIVHFKIYAIVVSSRRFVPKYDNNEYYRAVRRLIKNNIQFVITPHTVNL